MQGLKVNGTPDSSFGINGIVVTSEVPGLAAITSFSRVNRTDGKDSGRRVRQLYQSNPYGRKFFYCGKI